MEVECPPGNVVGSVEQNINCYRPTLDINDQNGDVQYVIEGPSSCKTFCKGIIQMGIFKLPSKYQYHFLGCCGKCCMVFGKRKCCCFSRDIIFNITDAKSGDKVGDIRKLWAGPLERERGLDNYDRFGIDFPDDANVHMKTVLVSSCFLIDYLYFEGGDEDED